MTSYSAPNHIRRNKKIPCINDLTLKSWYPYDSRNWSVNVVALRANMWSNRSVYHDENHGISWASTSEKKHPYVVPYIAGQQG